jgi:DNA-binding GntR family transcriptional regulator
MNTEKKAKIKKSITTQAYELLKEKMVTIELAPGMKLEEQDLMDRLNLGRTPIREAIKMLIAEGLVVSHGTNATYVEELTLKSAKDLRQIIQSMGAVAFTLANPANDFTEIIEELEILYDQMDKTINNNDFQAFAVLNSDFHKTLARVADNSFLDHALERIYFFESRQAYLIYLSLGGKTDYYNRVQGHHLEFIQFLREKDFNKMIEVYEKHMEAARRRLVAYFSGSA